MNRITRSISLVIVFAAISLSGCATAPSSFGQYKSTIQQFQTATDSTATATMAYIQDLNNFERSLEIKMLRDDRARELNLPKYFTGNQFDLTAIDTRSQAFQVIKDYTKMLAMLADSDAETRWVAATGELKKSVDLMTGSTAGQSDYTSALTDIANFAGKAWINGKRSKALDEAIVSAAPAIEEISALLGEDMQTVYNQRITAMDLPLFDLLLEYNDIQAGDTSTSSEKRRNKLLDELTVIVASRDTTIETLNNLQHSMQAFDAAHLSLVSYAKKPE